MGLTSLTVVKFKDAVHTEFGVDLPITAVGTSELRRHAIHCHLSQETQSHKHNTRSSTNRQLFTSPCITLFDCPTVAALSKRVWRDLREGAEVGPESEDEDSEADPAVRGVVRAPWDGSAAAAPVTEMVTGSSSVTLTPWSQRGVSTTSDRPASSTSDTTCGSHGTSSHDSNDAHMIQTWQLRPAGNGGQRQATTSPPAAAASSSYVAESPAAAESATAPPRGRLGCWGKKRQTRGTPPKSSATAAGEVDRGRGVSGGGSWSGASLGIEDDDAHDDAAPGCFGYRNRSKARHM